MCGSSARKNENFEKVVNPTFVIHRPTTYPKGSTNGPLSSEIAHQTTVNVSFPLHGMKINYWDLPKILLKEGTRGCRNLTLRDLDSRNERIRIIAFQNIKKFSNRLSKNIFSARRKLEKISKFSKIRSDLMKISLEIWGN